MTAAIVVIALLFVALNWYYYTKTRAALDTEFDIRLRALASLAASSIDPLTLDTLTPELAGFDTADGNRDALMALAAGYSLAGVHILREDGVVLLTTRPDLFRPGELYPLFDMDSAEILRALGGTPSSTGLHESPGGGYFKAGYAPGSGQSFVAAVEADAKFLQGLSGLRTLLIAASTVTLLGLAVFVWLVSKATGSLIRTRESLLHAETLASMGRMAAGIAHEIRNPLFIIRSSAEQMKSRHPGDSDEIDEFIIEEVDRLDGTLTDYLLFAKNESTARVETDLARLLERSVRLVSDPAHAGNVDIETRMKVGSAPFTGEEKKLQQVFLNLLLNALQALEGTGSLTISLMKSGNSYIMEFADSGPGISDKDLGRVFEPFYTTRPTGSGLGLAIAKRVISDHGGEIAIASGDTNGTIVTVRLPAGRASDEQSTDNR
jgi:signal transduction histidine kinase